MLLSNAEVDFIDNARIARFATCNTGLPHVVPVSHVFDRKTSSIYFVTDYGTKKLRNLKANNRVAMVFDEYMEKSMGLMVEGEATYMEKGPEYMRIRKLLYEKFPQYHRPELHFEEGEAPIVKITPTKTFSWGIK